MANTRTAYKTVSVKLEVYKRLKPLGDLGDSFSKVIDRLIDFYIQHNTPV